METQRHFYPRSPCGERRSSYTFRTPRRSISIHALLAESDGHGPACRPAERNFYPRSPCGERPKALPKPPRQPQFLSTLSLRRATYNSDNIPPYRTISIHALLAESDLPPGPGIGTPGLFLSTLSLRRATVSLAEVAKYATFLSTLSLRRATDHLDDVRAAIGFLSTLSLRRATGPAAIISGKHNISIHALLAESDIPAQVVNGDS